VLVGDVRVESLTLDGCLRVEASPGTRVIVRDTEIRNAGWQPVELTSEDPATEPERSRAFVLSSHTVVKPGFEATAWSDSGQSLAPSLAARTVKL
jgi:hypothetical protein